MQSARVWDTLLELSFQFLMSGRVVWGKTQRLYFRHVEFEVKTWPADRDDGIQFVI